MGRYDDNFVPEDLDVQLDESQPVPEGQTRGQRKINRRDAARAAVEALSNNDLRGKTVRVWTQTKG
jgi:hypothetical protein